MLALAGHSIGIECVAYATADDEPACNVTRCVRGAWDDHRALDEFCARIDVATYEFENVPLDAVRHIGARVPLYPSFDALRIAADRVEEKRLFRKLGIETAPFAEVNTEEELRAAVVAIGLPAVLKTRTLGYDGKGQYVLRSEADVEMALPSLGHRPSILEGFVSFAREVSAIGVRGMNGAIACYALAQNTHRNGILELSLAPLPDQHEASNIEATAHGYVRSILESLDYVGVLALELFDCNGRLLANEMAPRVHNTGHHTIEAAETSQFENHLRAITGLPLGSTAPRGFAAMMNLIGSIPDASKVLAVEGAHLHVYGKEPRPHRKMGHVTIRADDSPSRDERLRELQAMINK
jgi:5-(carboxyamino)imidazole ribonucleotide synthase